MFSIIMMFLCSIISLSLQAMNDTFELDKKIVEKYQYYAEKALFVGEKLEEVGAISKENSVYRAYRELHLILQNKITMSPAILHYSNEMYSALTETIKLDKNSDNQKQNLERALKVFNRFSKITIIQGAPNEKIFKDTLLKNNAIVDDNEKNHFVAIFIALMRIGTIEKRIKE